MTLLKVSGNALLDDAIYAKPNPNAMTLPTPATGYI